MPNDIKVIGSYAFYNSDLSSIELSEGLIEIGEYAFSGTAVTRFNVSSDNEVYSAVSASPYILNKEGTEILGQLNGARREDAQTDPRETQIIGI